MRRHDICFPETSTIECLAEKMPACYGAVAVFGGKVIAAAANREGRYGAAVYGFAGTLEGTVPGGIECGIELLETANSTFRDCGHALAWAIQAAREAEKRAAARSGL